MLVEGSALTRGGGGRFFLVWGRSRQLSSLVTQPFSSLSALSSFLVVQERDGISGWLPGETVDARLAVGGDGEVGEARLGEPSAGAEAFKDPNGYMLAF